MRSGRPEVEDRLPVHEWAPVITTYAGLTEIAAEWVARHRDDVHILDVRSAAEFDGQLGHLNGAQLIPIDELRARSGEISREKPVVVVCQTGKRAGMGTLILKKAGFSKVANLAGGMVRWHDLGLPD
ncbi:MAG: rhodanese-like domain-containing protein [Myxococcales bacterium]